jgi:hypothetical protein
VFFQVLMLIDLQGQYGFSTAVQVLQDIGEGGNPRVSGMEPAPGPGEGGAMRSLIAKIGLGEGGVAVA